MRGAGITIELARPDDVAALLAIEREAGALFANASLPLAGIDDQTPLEELAEAQRAGRLFVARARGGDVVGFALVELVGAEPHLEEMDVSPSHGRQGVGRRLLAAVQQWVVTQRYPAITLTTFRDVPWNAPFYASAGFRGIAPGELSPELADIVRDETRRGLDPSTRVVMRWCVGSGDAD